MNCKSGIFSMILIIVVMHLLGCTNAQENMVQTLEPALSSFAQSNSGVPTPPESEQPKADDLNQETEHSDVYDIAPNQISDYHPFVVNNYLIGGSNSRQWFAANEFAGELTEEEVYNTYNLSGYTGVRECLAVESESVNGGEPFCEMVMIGYEYGEEDVIALNANWEGMPRKPVMQAVNNSIYEDVIRELLEEYGLEDPDIELCQNYRIDFEGDGVDEVILYAESKRESDTEWDYNVTKGCFSILVLRKIVGGEVKNHVICYDVHPDGYDPDSMDFRHRLHFPVVGFVDVNGDGKLELIGSWRYYEGLLYEVFEISDEGAKPVIMNGIAV